MPYLNCRTSPNRIPFLFSELSHSTFFLFFPAKTHYADATVARDRMLASAMNFAIGFFGYPFEGQYQQSITIEADGVCVLPPLYPN